MQARPNQIPDAEAFKDIATMELTKWFKNVLSAQTTTDCYTNVVHSPDDFPTVITRIYALINQNAESFFNNKYPNFGLLNDLNLVWNVIHDAKNLEASVNALLKLHKKHSDANLNNPTDDAVTYALTHDIQLLLMTAVATDFITGNLKGKVIEHFADEDTDRLVYGKSSSYISPEGLKEPPQPKLTEKELLVQNRELKSREKSLLRENSFLKKKVDKLEHDADTLHKAAEVLAHAFQNTLQRNH